MRRCGREALRVAEREDHDPSGIGGFRGTPADIQIAREILDMTKRMAEIISHHSGQDVDQVLRDIDRDRFMSPEEAIEYGLIDAIMGPRGVAADG